jgi:ribosome-binding factor A
MTSGRMRRVDEAIRQVIGEAVAGELKDPRVGFVTVTDVRTSADLSHARVYVSVLDEAGIRAAGTCPPASSETGTDWGGTRSAEAGRRSPEASIPVSASIPKSASAAGACPPASAGEPRREQTLAGLRSAHGYLQQRIASELRLKRTPTLSFVYDDTTDRAMRLGELLDGLETGTDE